MLSNEYHVFKVLILFHGPMKTMKVTAVGVFIFAFEIPDRLAVRVPHYFSSIRGQGWLPGCPDL